MIDVDYSGSELVVDHGAGKANAGGPRPGQWYPDWCKFAGTSHRVLVFGGDVEGAVGRLARRWANVVELAHNPAVDSVRAGLPLGGVVMIRPDGHVGFRFPAVDADALAALDRHLGTYLITENGEDG